MQLGGKLLPVAQVHALTKQRCEWIPKQICPKLTWMLTQTLGHF